jgi:hypothetical protein
VYNHGRDQLTNTIKQRDTEQSSMRSSETRWLLKLSFKHHLMNKIWVFLIWLNQYILLSSLLRPFPSSSLIHLQLEGIIKTGKLLNDTEKKKSPQCGERGRITISPMPGVLHSNSLTKQLIKSKMFGADKRSSLFYLRTRTFKFLLYLKTIQGLKVCQ